MKKHEVNYSTMAYAEAWEARARYLRRQNKGYAEALDEFYELLERFRVNKPNNGPTLKEMAHALGVKIVFVDDDEETRG